MNLLRLKAISLKCEVPNAPILGKLADRLLYLTRSYSGGLEKFAKTAKLNLYERERINLAIREKVWQKKSVVTSDARTLCEDEFGIHWESQIAIEKQFETMELDHYSDPVLDAYIKNDNKIYYTTYTNTSKEWNNCIDTRRLCHYQTYLPNNPLSDDRNSVPLYAA